MPVARITTPGLAAIGVSVLLLWGCLIGERLLIRSAMREEAQVLHEMHLLRQRQRSEPAADPMPRRPMLPRAARG